MNNESLFLASEINELKVLLADLPAENLIERIGLEARLETVQQALAALPVHTAQKARLTFRGRPVVGSRGIAADFGAKAAAAFSDAFAAIAAALNDGLRDMGPIPDRERNQLLITSTAIGSFGFEFELPAAEDVPALFPETPSAQRSIEKIESLFRLAAQGSDDDVTEVIEEIHPRAVRKVHDFLDLLVQQQAWCALEFEGQSFRFTGYDQIKASSDRLKDDNIKETRATYRGELQGVLPASRTFEFQLSNREGILKGKVDKAIDDPDILNRDWLHKPAAVTLNVIQVGQGRPRFTLMKLDDLKL